MEYILLGLVVAFNIVLVIWKFRHHRFFDGLLDAGALVLVGSVFTGGFAALTMGAIGSAVVSLYLLIFPPMFSFGGFKPKKQVKKYTFKPRITEILW